MKSTATEGCQTSDCVILADGIHRAGQPLQTPYGCNQLMRRNYKEFLVAQSSI